MKITVILFIFISSLISKPLSIEGNMKTNPFSLYHMGCKNYDEKESKYVNQICINKINVDYKISTLMGEPTRIFKINWEIKNIVINGKAYFMNELSKETQKAYKNIKIISPTFFGASYEVLKPVLMGGNTIGKGSFRFNGDYIGQSGQSGFSVTGSPSWNKLFIDEFYTDCNTERDETRYFDEKSARKLFLNHFIKKDHRKRIEVKSICTLTFSGISELNRAISKECKFNEKACEKEAEEKAKEGHAHKVLLKKKAEKEHSMKLNIKKKEEAKLKKAQELKIQKENKKVNQFMADCKKIEIDSCGFNFKRKITSKRINSFERCVSNVKISNQKVLKKLVRKAGGSIKFMGRTGYSYSGVKSKYSACIKEKVDDYHSIMKSIGRKVTKLNKKIKLNNRRLSEIQQYNNIKSNYNYYNNEYNKSGYDHEYYSNKYNSSSQEATFNYPDLSKLVGKKPKPKTGTSNYKLVPGDCGGCDVQR